MNKKYRYFLLTLLVSVSLGFVSCNSNDDSIIDDNSSELIIEKTSVNVLVGKTSILDIKDGNGDYKAFSTNEDIATVKIVDGKLNIDTHKNGRTSIVVSDKNSNYQNIDVVSYYDKIILEESNFLLKKRLGSNGTKRIQVVGNGEYVVSSDDENIATVSSNDQFIVVIGKKDGKVNISVIDKLGYKTSFTVTVENTTKAYEAEELAEIMGDSTSRFYYGEELEAPWGILYKSIDNGYNVYGWEYYMMYYQKVYFKGDTSVGVKEDAMFSQSYNVRHNNVPINFEIVKNDGSMIWAIYSFIENDILRYGYFVRPI